MNKDRLHFIIASILALLSFSFVINAYVSGDINGDDRVTSADYIALKKYFSGQFELSTEQLKIADVNGDGRVTSADYIGIRKMFSLPQTTTVPNSEYYYLEFEYTDPKKLENDILKAREKFDNSPEHSSFTSTLMERYSAYYTIDDLPFESIFEKITAHVYDGYMHTFYSLDDTAINVSYYQFKNTEAWVGMYKNEKIAKSNNVTLLDNCYHNGKEYVCVYYDRGNPEWSRYWFYLDDGNDSIRIDVSEILVNKYGKECFLNLVKHNVCEPLDIRIYGCISY